MADKGQPEPQTALYAGSRAVLLAKAVENVGEKTLVDATAGIPHNNLNVRIDALQTNLNTLPPGGEFDCVGNKIPYNLLQSFCIAGNQAHLRIEYDLQANAFRLRCRTKRLDSGFNHCR